MRSDFLFLLLVSLGVQGWIAADTQSFAELFGSPATTQAIAFSWMVFFGLGVIEALIFITWLNGIDRDIDINEHQIEHEEDNAITGVAVELRDERAGALERLTTALSIRLRRMIGLQRGAVGSIATLGWMLLMLGLAIGFACAFWWRV